MTEDAYTMVVQALDEDDGGGFLAFAPDLHGCVGDGDTPAAAIADLGNAIGEWIDEAQRLNRPVPKPGAMAARVKEGRERINSLMRAQGDLIKQQDKQLIEVRCEMDRIKASIAQLECDLHPGFSYGRWAVGEMPPHVADATRRRRGTGLPH